MSGPVILAFDTTTSILSAALSYSGKLSQKQIHVKNPSQDHASFLFPLLEDLLEDAGLTYSSLSYLAVTKGPGSFTGIRIGLAAIQGLKCALNIPCFIPTSLSTLAFQGFRQAPQTPKLLALINNKRGEYYGQVFTSDLNSVNLVKLWSPEDIHAFRTSNPQPCMVSFDVFDREIEPHNSSAVTLIHYLTFCLQKDLPIEQDANPFYLVMPSYATRPNCPSSLSS